MRLIPISCTNDLASKPTSSVYVSDYGTKMQGRFPVGQPFHSVFISSF